MKIKQERLKEIEKELIEINKEERKKEKNILLCEYELENIMGTFSNLQDMLEEIQDKKEKLKEEIKKIKKCLITEKDDNLPDDDFHDVFKTVSMFATVDSNSIFRYVSTKTDEMIASDGYRIITAKVEVPEELQNGFIDWDERNNLLSSLRKNNEKDISFYDTESFINRIPIADSKSMSIDTFYNKYFEETKGDIDKLNIEGMKTAFNTEFMEETKKVFANEIIKILVAETRYSPIIFKNEKYEVVILPVVSR